VVLRPVTTGADTYVYWSATEVGDVPPGVVTVTSVNPAVPVGQLTTIVVAVSLPGTIVAAVVPKSTNEALESAVPVIVTFWPPVSGPCDGLTLVIVGIAT
jgi:hypothetical protein